MMTRIETHDGARALTDQEIACIVGGTRGSIAPPNNPGPVTSTHTVFTPEGLTTFTVGRFCECIMFQTWSFW